MISPLEMTRGCSSKKYHPSAWAAWRLLQEMWSKGALISPQDDNMHVYPCAFCDGFHLGHGKFI